MISLFSSCIRDEAKNPEADIIALSFPEGSLRSDVEIYNDYVVIYPKLTTVIDELDITHIEVSEGATWNRIPNKLENDTLFYIKVVSESKEYSKTYPVSKVSAFPEFFTFKDWYRPSKKYQYENPTEGSLQWYSSNNGASIAWNNSEKKASEYPVSRIEINGSMAAQVKTMVGPGEIAGGINFIPCMAGSLYLGGFNALTGLSNPLRSTSFGVPFDSGKPIFLSGEYMFNEGKHDYINSDGTTDKNKRDICSIYAVLFKVDKENPFLYGDNISSSPNIIARAEIKERDIRQSDRMIPFHVEFNYDSYPTPFSWAELENNEYKMSIVFSSSSQGQNYEGRPGNTLIVDNIRLHYEK